MQQNISDLKLSVVNLLISPKLIEKAQFIQLFFATLSSCNAGVPVKPQNDL